MLRAALRKQGAPEDLVLCLETPSIPLAQELMSICDLTIATGGPAMVKAAYSSGKPAYGVGAGNATVVVDETADLADAAMNTRISKTQNHGSGCSCDGNLLVEATVYDRFLERCRRKAATSPAPTKSGSSRRSMWDADGRRTLDTVARAAGVIAEKAGFTLPDGKSFIIVKEDRIGKAHRFSSEKLSPVLAIFKYSGFDRAARDGLRDLRGRRQGPLGRHRVVRRRPHPSAGVDGAGQPHHGAAAERPRQCRLVHQRHAA